MSDEVSDDADTDSYEPARGVAEHAQELVDVLNEAGVAGSMRVTHFYSCLQDLNPASPKPEVYSWLKMHTSRVRDANDQVDRAYKRAKHEISSTADCEETVMWRKIFPNTITDVLEPDDQIDEEQDPHSL